VLKIAQRLAINQSSTLHEKWLKKQHFKTSELYCKSQYTVTSGDHFTHHTDASDTRDD